MRTEGAALFSLLRNLGAAIGVSVATSMLARNAQAMHEIIGASVTPFNRALQSAGSVHQVARSGRQAWSDIAGPNHQPAGADRRVCQRLRAAYPSNPTGMATASDDAPSAESDDGRGGRMTRYEQSFSRVAVTIKRDRCSGSNCCIQTGRVPTYKSGEPAH